ncbi:MAG TPA: TetR/AcrR family transcriptional regulator [Ktedonobacterales bacterium]|nr:TetR/AcrR family transcriptional regulator [Ktedonobacterales bacterium]
MDEQSEGSATVGQRDRQGEILDAAFEEFATEGFRGATIKRIARRAQLQSQALIYWYFPTKEALFQAALGRHLPILQLIVDPTVLLDLPPEDALPKIARAFLAVADRPVAQRLLRLIVPEVIRRPQEVDHLGGAVIAKALDFVKRYLAHQVELGRLRPHDVRASARAFVGMLLPQLGGKLLFPTIRADGLTDDEHIDAIVEIFLRGLAPLADQPTHQSEPRDAGARDR